MIVKGRREEVGWGEERLERVAGRGEDNPLPHIHPLTPFLSGGSEKERHSANFTLSLSVSLSLSLSMAISLSESLSISSEDMTRRGRGADGLT